MKKITLILLLIPLVGISQLPISITNQASFGGSAGTESYLNDIIYLPDGSMILMGHSNSYVGGNKSVSSFGFNDIWILKLSSNFTIQWQKGFGGDGNEFSPKGILLNDGNLLIGCYSYSGNSGNKSVDNYGDADIWLLKLDANGDIIWQNTYGGVEFDFMSGLIEFNDGTIIIYGGSDSPISGNKSADLIGGTDIWLIKIDNNGEIIWDKTFGSDLDDIARTSVFYDTNKLLLTGRSNGNISGNKSENSYGDDDIWIVKLDTAGNFIWDKTIGGSLYDEPYKIIYNLNSFYVLGTSESNVSGLKTENSFGGFDIWVLKIDDDGNIVWDKTIGGFQNDFASDMFISENNQLIIAGSSNSDISGLKTENSKGLNDIWIFSLDTNGNFLWDKTIGGNSLDNSVSIYEKSSQSYIISGISASAVSGDKTSPKYGGRDYWILEVNNLLSTNNIIQKNEIEIYPNPAQDYFSFSSMDISNIKIQDIQGKLIFEIENYVQKIDISLIPSGIYFVSYQFKGGIYTKKLVVN